MRQAFKDISIPPATVSPEWALLPACIIEDLLKLLDHYHVFENEQKPGKFLHAFYQKMEPEIFVLLIMLILGAGDHIKNPSVRGDAVSFNCYLGLEVE